MTTRLAPSTNFLARLDALFHEAVNHIPIVILVRGVLANLEASKSRRMTRAPTSSALL